MDARKGLLSTPTLLSPLVLDVMRQQLKRLAEMDQDILDIEKRLALWKKENTAVARIMDIPGVGLLTATAIVATVGDMKAFRSGREFAAFLGLVPRQSGTGGKVRLMGISKRGDVYLRTLLVHGARAVVGRQVHNRNPWLDRLLARRPYNVVAVALANKIARTIWALLTREEAYQARYAAAA